MTAKIYSVNKKYCSIVDDKCEIFNKTSYGWYRIKTKNKYYFRNKSGAYLHRLIMALHLGIYLEDLIGEIDHIDGNGLNNQISNLRIAPNRSSQMANMKHHENSTSIYKGVHYRPKYNHPWQSKLMKDGKNIYLGYFDTEIEAATQYVLGAIYFFENFAKLNFEDNRKEYIDKINSGYNPTYEPRKESSKIKGVSFDKHAGK